MTKWVEWSEPWGSTGFEVVSRMRWKDVATVQRLREPRYESDEQAVDDFLVVHWARIVELPDA